MTVQIKKTLKGTITGYLVVVQRDKVKHKKLFKKTQEKEARDYNEKLLNTLPPIRKVERHYKARGETPEQKRKRLRAQPTQRNTSKDQYFVETMGCCIYRSPNEDDKCEKLDHCSNYNKCLDVAAKRNWPGFINE